MTASHDSSSMLGRLGAVLFEAAPATLKLAFVAGTALGRLGYPAASWVDDPQALIKRLHPDEREAVLAMLRAVGADGRPRHLDHRLVAADGSERWFRTEAHVVDRPERHLVVILIDVTEARHTAEALQAAEAWLRRVVNNTPLILMALDKDGVFTLAEGSGLRGLGLTPEATVGHNLFVGYKDEPELLDHVRRALAGETFVAYDRVRAFGSWWETHWTPLLDAQGRPAGATAVAIDITDRKRAEDASARSMSLLRATLEATTDGVLVVDKGGRIVDFNRRFAEMWHLPDDVLETREDSRALAYAAEQLRDPNDFVAKVHSLWADPDASSHDILELRDGRIFERDSAPQRVEGQSVGRVWSFRDVTAHRRAERRATFLAAASKVLAGPLEEETPFEVVARLAVPYLGDWSNMLVYDETGHVRSVAACHIDPTQAPLVRRLYPDMRYGGRGVARVLLTGEPLICNDLTDADLSPDPTRPSPVSIIAADKLAVMRALRMRAYFCVPLRVRGQTLGAMVFATRDPNRRYDEEDLAIGMDLAQRAALAIDNQRLYRASKQAVALRDEFLSVASHELRTPVTSLMLAVQSALSVGDSAPPGFLRQALESAERQSRRLGRLVDTLLDVSRVESGRLELAHEPVDLVPLVADVVRLFADDARRAGCAVQVDTTLTTLVGRWDRGRLEQVVSNLLSNALKYGAGHPIVITIARSDDRARLGVSDQGIGIPAPEHGRIFERFERAVSARHYGGLGLGLYIVRRIVDALGGSITVESAPGAGATFTVELPLEPGAQ